MAFLWRGSKGFLPIFVCFLVIQTFVSAQTVSEESSVSILFMTFSGDNAEETEQLGSAMRTELEWISRISGYGIIQSVDTLSTSPERGSLSLADQARNPKYLINGVITREGEASVADISLWALEDPPSLIFSLAFDYQQIDDALSMVPFYSWSLYAILPVLERVSKKPDAGGEDAEAATKAGGGNTVYIVDNVWQSRWLYLGLRGGISPRFYNFVVDYPKELGFTWEAALQAEVQFFRFPWGSRNVFFALQGETIFTEDKFKLFDEAGNISERNFFSMMTPLLLKVNYKPGPFALSLYGGLYYIGYIFGNSAGEGIGQPAIRKGEKFSLFDFLGYSMGFKFGIKAGKRGTAFFDLRYSSDLGITEIGSLVPVTYQRNIFSLALGYDVGLFNRK